MLNKIKGNIYECYGIFANLIWLESNSFPNSPYSVLLILRIHAPEDQGGIMINHVFNHATSRHDMSWISCDTRICIQVPCKLAHSNPDPALSFPIYIHKQAYCLFVSISWADSGNFCRPRESNSGLMVPLPSWNTKRRLIRLPYPHIVNDLFLLCYAGKKLFYFNNIFRAHFYRIPSSF
jgi:hypothetical protein